ncbi:hypothetical protein GE061_009886 [Apolygus lucorum]|uniref:Uncharacterized protein n=1 Tax=Apolygus lucorum TaxID=248454 RepID=A0A6A4JIN3_APOLU|nr:hypothetical protein GE061_009886 [Apolygus lucorum]
MEYNMEQVSELTEPFDWMMFLDLKTFSSVISNAQGEFKKLLDNAEFALSRNPKSMEIEVMVIVLHVMSKMGVYDHSLVGKILDMLFELEGHFIPLFLDALVRDDDISEADSKAVEYFLTIGSTKRYRLGDGRQVRFVDVPFMNSTLAGITLRSGRPSALRTFLRFGADPSVALESLAVTGLTTDPRRLSVKRKRALDILASAAPQLPLSLASLLPTPPGPLSLKHSCKVVVRRCLAEAGYLPLGIPTLRVPSDLHRYLDLDVF